MRQHAPLKTWWHSDGELGHHRRVKSFTLVCLFFVSTLHAETMGWRVPLEHFTSELYPEYAAPDHRVPQLEKRPAKSAFFKKGDRLLDLSQIIEPQIRLSSDIAGFDPYEGSQGSDTELKPQHRCEWIVWNPRSGMLVARGNTVQLLLLRSFLQINQLPARVETSLVLKTSSGDQKKVGISGRSGERMHATSPMLDFEVAPSLSPDKDIADIQFVVSYRCPNGELFEVNSATTMGPRKLTPIAAWKEHGDGWSMSLSWTAYTTYGVEWDDIEWIEHEGKVMTLQTYDESPNSEPLDLIKVGELVVRTFRVPPDFPQRLAGTYDDEADPFAVEDLPLPLRPGGRSPLLDMRKLLEAYGVKFEHPDSLAFYRPASSTLVIVSDAEGIDLIEQIAGYGGCGHASNTLVHANWQLGSATLTTRSGEKASISSTLMDERSTLLEIAPCVGANQRLIDLQYFLEPSSKVISLSSAVTLQNDLETKVAVSTDEGQECPVLMRAVIGEHDH